MWSLFEQPKMLAPLEDFANAKRNEQMKAKKVEMCRDALDFYDKCKQSQCEYKNSKCQPCQKKIESVFERRRFSKKSTF